MFYRKVYDNVIAIVEDGANHRQLVVGAMLESGKAWRLVQLPPALEVAEASVAASGYFFNSPVVSAGGVGPEPMADIDAPRCTRGRRAQIAREGRTARRRRRRGGRREWPRASPILGPSPTSQR